MNNHIKANVKSPSILRRTRGFTLVELMLVVTAALILIGIGLSTYRQVQSSSTTLSMSTSVMQLGAAVRGVYPKGDYTGLTAAQLVATGTVPNSMINSSKQLVSAWGALITLAPTTVGSSGVGNNAFSITLPGVPRDACNRLLPAIADAVGTILVSASGSSVSERGGVNAGLESVPGFPGVTVMVTVKDDNATPPIAYSPALAISGCNSPTVSVTLVMM